MERANNVAVPVETAKQFGLTPAEYDRIVEILGRKPNFTELSAFLFGEGQGRAVLSVNPDKQGQLEGVLTDMEVPLYRIGRVTDGHISFDGESFGNIYKWLQLYGNVLNTYFEN